VPGCFSTARSGAKVFWFFFSKKNCFTYFYSLGANAVLELRPNCEYCDRDLAPDSAAARICSYECTFCVACAEGVLGGVCPNCGGGLVARPIRPVAMLARHPASRVRVEGGGVWIGRGGLEAVSKAS
jgi:hypothetical protein